MPNLINTNDMVGAYMGSNQVIALYMGTTHVWGEELGSQAIEIDCFDNMEAFEGAACSSVTITLVEMDYNMDEMGEVYFNEGDVVGTITCERDDNEGAEWDHRWYIASSAVTSAITSAEMYHDEEHGWMMRVVAPVFGNCVMNEYRFKAQAIVDGMGMAKVILKDENDDDAYCSNGYLHADWYEASWVKRLIITNVPYISGLPLMADYDEYYVNVSDSDKFDFTHRFYYDMEQSTIVDEISFDNYDNPNVTYTYDQSAGTLVVYADWNDYEYGYDDMSGEEKWLGDNHLLMSYNHNEEGYYGFEKQPFRFTTGTSITRQFAACNTQMASCSGSLIIDFTIPNDGDDHVVEIIEPNLGNVIGSLSANVTNETFAVIDCPSDPDELYFTESVLDYFSEGYVRWDFEGPFNGTYMIYVDGSPLINATPVFNGTFKIVYVDTNSDAMRDYTSYDAYSCEVENGGTWDDINQECTYPE